MHLATLCGIQVFVRSQTSEEFKTELQTLIFEDSVFPTGTERYSKVGQFWSVAPAGRRVAEALT